MDLIKQELQRKRHFLESEFSGRKALRRAEINHLEIQKLREKELQQLQSRKSSSPPPPPPQSKMNSHVPQSEKATGKDDPALPRDEVIRRLRVLRQPITLFGEDDVARYKRLQSVIESGVLEIDADEIGEGQTNDFLRDIYELRKKQKVVVSNSSEGANGGNEGGKEEMSKIKGEKDKDKEVPFEELCDEDKIKVFFKRLLDEWGQEVEEMPEAERRTAKGKSVLATYKQCARYLDPLFKMCKRKVGDMMSLQEQIS
ncbi:hypothetical protein LUZ61_001480 [Rhynchospora tenuis]|uniref:Pre-mRNA processing factor 4 (PRP4)-like domain-containing protein n=1 Tax=Rhynchospora tenuis TaxID=198213 RepID=A0AAD5ZH32_9POAL|nr:hypothetical protein LUZ61_001480 [Rhynchospora tenuis]